MHQGQLSGVTCRTRSGAPQKAAGLRRQRCHVLMALLGLMAAGLGPARAADGVGLAPAKAPPGSSAPDAFSGPSAFSEPLVVSDDGSLIIDRRSRLAWTRCVEGMVWNGQNCTGEPRRMTYGEALALASSRYKSEGVGWRIPRLTELRRFAGWDAASHYFPADPRDWTWTSTLRIDTVQNNAYNYDNITKGLGGTQDRLGVQQGWAVNLGTGETRGDVARKTLLVVRLVRPVP